MFRFIPDPPAGGRILLDGEAVAEIRSLGLCNVQCSRGGGILIGPEVPMPLYWQQYMDHENPERNTGAHALIPGREEGERLVLRCEGANASGTVRSIATLTVYSDQGTGAIDYLVETSLSIRRGRAWRIAKNASHGELEFCNLWPAGVFTAGGGMRKRYHSCLVEAGGRSILLPHLHVDTAARQDIPMKQWDRWTWVLEDENPGIEILGGEETRAGLCAYMWDAHFGLRPREGIREGVREGLIFGPTEYRAAFRLFAIGREEAERRMRRAAVAHEPELAYAPVYRPEGNNFSTVMADEAPNPEELWPWEREVLSGDPAGIRLRRETAEGWDDNCSLRIDHLSEAASRWLATTIGPAFGGEDFPEQAAYHLVCMARSDRGEGKILARIRMHREGTPGLFDPGTYEMYECAVTAASARQWTRLECRTPPLSPRPDRIHILLEWRGTGTVLFDAVHLRIRPPSKA